MTREQANEYVKSALSKTWNEKKCEEIIKALEQEPNCPFYEIDDDGHGLCKNHRYMDECEDAVQRTSNADKKHVENTLEDAVSRQAVIDAIHKAIYDFFDIVDDDAEEPINDKDELLLDVNKAITTKIKNLQPVEPKRQKGHWIDHQEGRWIYAKCSECGSVHDVKSDYCPNCGAHMKPYKADKESEDADSD